MNKPLRRFLPVFPAVLLVTFVTLLPFCNLMFSCGCTVVGPAHCNVHNATGPRCPWCAHGNGAFVVGYGLIVLGVAACILGSLVSRRGRGCFALPFAAGLLGYFLAGSAVGLGTAVYYGYPTWFGLHPGAAAAHATLAGEPPSAACCAK